MGFCGVAVVFPEAAFVARIRGLDQEHDTGDDLTHKQIGRMSGVLRCTLV